MSHNIPLTDADRQPWLALIRSTADRMCQTPPEGASEKERLKGVVIACSALKRSYRDLLRGKKEESHHPPPAEDLPQDHPIVDAVDVETEAHLLEEAASEELRTFFVYIEGSRKLLEERMCQRKGHFMKVAMLDSQLRTLESPVGEEGVVRVSLEKDMEEQVKDAVEGLRALGFHETHTEVMEDGTEEKVAPQEESEEKPTA